MYGLERKLRAELKGIKQSHLNRQFTETFKASLLFVNNLLVEANGIFLQGKHVVSKDDYLVIAPLVKANEKLASTELVGVHRVEQDALLRPDGHVLSVKLRRHWAPHLKHRQGYIGQMALSMWIMLAW